VRLAEVLQPKLQSLHPLRTPNHETSRPHADRVAEANSAYLRATPKLQTTPAPAKDRADILGIPEAELTPAVRQALSELAGQVKALKVDRTRLIERLRQAEDMADTDTLVPVFNRRAFVRELGRVISFAERYEVPASVIFFDLDGFKQINDRHGHAAGDAVLKGVGEALLGSIRESDLVGRIGGDEFAVILAKAGPSDARHKGEQLAATIRSLNIPFNHDVLHIGASFGTHTFERGDTAEQALSRADEAMYANKISRKVQSL
jgi:diguanylate cyclase (GGDEF)-like protein